MKEGDTVNHSKLGRGVVIRVCKYGGLMIDYSDKTGVKIRISHIDSVTPIDRTDQANNTHATHTISLYNKHKGEQMKNFTIETGMTNYNLLYAEYDDIHWGNKMCCVIWIKNGHGGQSFTWLKGDSLFASYLLDKTSFNLADLTGILSGVKKKFPGSIHELIHFDENYMYKGE